MIRPAAIVPILATSALAVISCITNPSLGTGASPPDPMAPTATAATDSGTGGHDAGPAAPRRPDAGTAVGDSGSTHAASCAALLARILAAPVEPPNKYAALDLASGSNPKGLTIDEANAAGCATFPTDSERVGGYRSAIWGTSDDVMVAYNVESRIIYSVELGKNYKGTTKFTSRVDGAFGAHTYEMTTTRVLRDGIEMAIDWAAPDRTWTGELYDGLMATFSPSIHPTKECEKSGDCLVLPDDGNDGAIFGVRDLAFYVMFKKGTGQLNGSYNFWKGGKADCSTPSAAHEAMDYASVFAGFGTPSIGGINLSHFKPDGMTWQAADAIACKGTMVTSPDPTYNAIAWGAAGELMLEFNKATNIGYRLTATAGYKGALVGNDGTNDYSVAIGQAVTKNGAPFVIDWAHPTAAVTELSNGIVNDPTDTDCVASGACTITPDDGHGHAILGFPDATFTITFDTGTTIARSFSALWPNGK